MRKFTPIFVFLLLFSLVQNLSAQVINVPAKSKEHFLKTYSNATEVDWSNNVTNYTVKFKKGTATMRAHYRLDGTWDFTETLLGKSDMPAAVSSSLQKSRFAEWEIASVARVDNDNKQTLYRVEVKKGIAKEFVFYKKNGKEVKTSVKL